MSERTASLGVRFAADVANASRALGSISDDARASLVSALSSTIDAGFLLRSSVLRRSSSWWHLVPSDDDDDDAASGEIQSVLTDVHLLTLKKHCPGEAPVTTRARSLALRSTQAECVLGACQPLVLGSPPLEGNGDGASSDEDEDGEASFELSSSTLAEISSLRSGCGGNYGEAEASESLGFMSITWGSDPHVIATSLGRSDGLNVTSLSVTRCGTEVSVQNLTSRILLHLQGHVEHVGISSNTVSGTCDVVGEFSVRCNASHELVEVVCPEIGISWDVACPAARAQSMCHFFDATAGVWDDYGCTVLNRSQSNVLCACNRELQLICSVT